MNLTPANMYNLDFLRTHISSQSKRIEKLTCAIAALQQNPVSSPKPLSKKQISRLGLADAQEQFQSQKRHIKDLLEELATIRKNLSLSGKRKQFIAIDDDLQIEAIPKIGSREYQAEELSSMELEGLLEKGYDEMAEENDVAAHAYFNEAIQRNPRDFRAYLEKARLYFVHEDYSNSLSYCEEGARYAPTNHDLVSLKSEIVERLDIETNSNEESQSV